MTSEGAIPTEPEASEATPTECTDTKEGAESDLVRGLEEAEAEKHGETEREKKTDDSMAIPPSTPQSGISILAHKIWIGNLDKRLTQETVLKFINRYGTPVSFRFHFKAGTDIMEPRGYCFVEYSTREEAEKAKAELDGKIALGKKIVVDWARFDPATKKTVDGVSETWDPSLVSEILDRGVSTSAKIAALEAKLRAMEEGKSAGVPRVTTTGQKPWTTEKRRGRRVPDTRVITQPQRRGRTHHSRNRGSII